MYNNGAVTQTRFFVSSDPDLYLIVDVLVFRTEEGSLGFMSVKFEIFKIS